MVAAALLALAIGIGAAGCGEDRGYAIAPLPPERLVVDGGTESLEDLLRVVERGIAERDAARLSALMVDAREFEEILHPAFPAAHPPIDASFETVWTLHWPDAVRGLERVLRTWGGKDVRIETVEFAAPDQDFVNFTLHEGSAVDVVVDGERIEGARLFGSVVEIGGRWKLLSYPDDPVP